MFPGLTVLAEKDLVVLIAGQIEFRCVATGYMDAVAPFTGLIASVMRRSNYNGFGCVQLKIAAGSSPLAEVEEYIDSIPMHSRDDVANLTVTDFSTVKAIDPTVEYLARPVFIEINPRICGPVYSDPRGFDRFLRLYVKSVMGYE